ncbi:MAG: hypothetical protein CVV64_17365 [Candidatus Wallbacteria bacterium HGW-Wallbacteria-1]|jgi:D-alanyl-lipoteichoic acid acyltransferase DltB (MBOAT superfamily)|uniref:MBOAT family protein n=1 Tax=Candidatus Wallbacteria bacterium HGW-Wallbacteria-1 TaxID=2013854 RepID=A0A2N1PKA8_9BACT|nr:MAG: hypothetical protein CVV64_17365 [Candidatus Wallbacteria bacterium HGW-Wallbacteria-1]
MERALHLVPGEFPNPYWYLLLMVFPILGFINLGKWRSTAILAVNLVYFTWIAGVKSLLAFPWVLLLWTILRQRCRTGKWTFWTKLWSWLWYLGIVALFVVHQTYSYDRPEFMKGMALTLIALGFLYSMLRSVDAFIEVGSRSQPLVGPVEFMNYVLPFHMLAVAQAYTDFHAQSLKEPEPHTGRSIARGFGRALFGILSFYVLSPTLIYFFLLDWPADTAWGFFFQLQIIPWNLIFQISGLCHMAVGAGILLRIETPENFNWPLFSRNMTEFWTRWHMQVGGFIKRNIFAPLMTFLLIKTRGKALVTCIFIAYTTAFLTCGLWHEFNWPWTMWGLWHALGLGVARTWDIWLRKRLTRAEHARYLANRWIGLLAWFINYEFVAVSVRLISP